MTRDSGDTVLTLAGYAAVMEHWYPAEHAEDWDRVGLIVGDPSRPVRRILVAIDPVPEVINEAVDLGVDLLITHHPLYLRGTSFLPETDPKGRCVARLIRSNIALFAAHTNADVAVDGVAQCLADLVGVTQTRPLIPTGTDKRGRPIGLGRVGCVNPTTLREFAEQVARSLPAGPHGLLVGGNEDAPVRTVAVSGGSGDHFLEAARLAGADVYLSADLRHHPASEHLAGGAPALLSASHWASEWPWLPILAQKLRATAEETKVSLDVTVSTMVTEPWTRHLSTSGVLK